MCSPGKKIKKYFNPKHEAKAEIKRSIYDFSSLEMLSELNEKFIFELNKY